MKRNRSFWMLLLLGIFLFSGWKVITLGMAYWKSGESYGQLEQLVSHQTEAPSSSGFPPERADSAPEVDFTALAEINPDIVGWIYLEDSRINYPIVWRDNAFYLTHLFTGEYNSCGCIFLDERCSVDFSDTNSILYGHHMNDGSMFADIGKFRDQEYYESHAAALVVTPLGKYQVYFFSGYVASTRDDAWKMEFSGEEYGAWLDEIVQKSCFRAEIVPMVEDRILTLSTCSNAFEDARFVLHGVLMEADS